MLFSKRIANCGRGGVESGEKIAFLPVSVICTDVTPTTPFEYMVVNHHGV